MTAFKRLVPVLIMLGTVTAIAQPDPAAPSPAGGSAATPAPATAAPAAPTATVTANVQISVGAMRERSAAIQVQIQEDYRYVIALRERIRKKKDVIKLDCVNDRLVQLKAQMNIADKTNQTLQPALEKDTTAARDVYSQLEGTGNAVKELREQANQCVGEPELFKQEAGLEVTRPDLVDDPGTVDPYVPEGAEVEPPGYASAFM
ncbi:MAG TPA: hypothetical protein VK427_27345 [Kofleriaceae bacterium]|nr:hypothetical protein [Kofleriaceae bacterium]